MKTTTTALLIRPTLVGEDAKKYIAFLRSFGDLQVEIPLAQLQKSLDEGADTYAFRLEIGGDVLWSVKVTA